MKNALRRSIDDLKDTIGDLPLSYVQINNDAIKDFCEKYPIAKVMHDEVFMAPELSCDDALQLMLFFNSVNACYWTQNPHERWNIDVRDQETSEWKKLDGSEALFHTMVSQWKYFSLLSDDVCMTPKALKIFIGGQGELLLLPERCELLQSTANVLKEKYQGSVTNFLVATEYDAEKMLEAFYAFPSFHDVQEFRGVSLPFMKRAQLCIKMFDEVIAHRISKGTQRGHKRIEHMEYLTGFADYKIPQVLVAHHIMKYRDDLQQAITARDLIPENDPREIEIRLASIEAMERIQDVFCTQGIETTSADVDTRLWGDKEVIENNKQSYHLTKTMAY